MKRKEKGPFVAERTGQGKYVNMRYYYHKSLVPKLPKEMQLIINQALEKVPTIFGNYDVVKYDSLKKEVTFIKSPDFDTAPEPTVGASCYVREDGTVRVTQGRAYNPQIYHHKWMMVDDDYTGFDVAASKARSEWYMNSGLIGKADLRYMGNKDYWDKKLKKIYDLSAN